MRANQRKIICNTSSYLVQQLMIYKKCSRNEALECLMETVVYEALMDLDTELYLESREALWDMLQEELTGNKEAIMSLR